MTLGNYTVANLWEIPSPAVLVYRPYVARNLDATIALAGGAERLRPHCKTHKTREVIRLWLERGVTRHKAATPRECAVCLEAGARDVLLAYQLVGPAVRQFAALAARYPDANLAALVDTSSAAEALAAAAAATGVTIGALVDLDTGLHRTGIAPERAFDLYALLHRLPGLRPAGLHVYDAQNNAFASAAAREAGVEASAAPVYALLDQLLAAGYAVPEVVAGGSATFPVYARRGAPFTGSPGTTVFWDHGYAAKYPDLDPRFTPAAVLLGRVVSRPLAGYLTLDVGTKAIAADPPVGKRGRILGLEDAETVVHNEEHWAVRSGRADGYAVGDTAMIIPTHICPCTNLHPQLHIVDADGQIRERWEVAARQRSV